MNEEEEYEGNNSPMATYNIFCFSILYPPLAYLNISDSLKTMDNYIVWKSVTIHLVLGFLLFFSQFYFKWKFWKLGLKQPEYDKLNLVFGYSQMVILTAFFQFYMWWIDYSAVIGCLVFSIYHFLILTFSGLFIIPCCRKYTYHYSDADVTYQICSVLSLPLFMVYLYYYRSYGCLSHYYLNHVFSMFIVELRIILSGRYSVEGEKTPVSSCKVSTVKSDILHI